MNKPKFTYFAIIASMRSGSNLLEQSLDQFSEISCHGELFNQRFIGHEKCENYLGFSISDREKKPFDLIDAVVTESPETIAGFRIFRGHDPRVITRILQDPNCAKIILQREQLDSFISLKIAEKTDQWLLRDASHRKSANVHFDHADFQTYCARQDTFYEDVRRTLQESGQTAYWVNYPEQKDIEVLNGIGKFLGVEVPKKSVKEILRRQNPAPMREKVENYDEMIALLGSSNTTAPVASVKPRARPNIPKMVTCLTCPLLFAPIPGGPNEEILRWMHALDGGSDLLGGFQNAVEDGEILHTRHSQRTLFEWMSAHPNVVSLTAARHPLVRAYDAFMTKIFPVGPGTYDTIRKQLVLNFGIELPDDDMIEDLDRDTLEEEGYLIKHHRAAFHGFLKFLKSNLDGQTSIRVDGLWASQLSFLSGFNTAVPISLIAKEGQLDPSFRYLESLLGKDTPILGAPLQPSHIIGLDEVYTRQTENLTRKVYEADYARFGFDDYQAALDA